MSGAAEQVEGLFKNYGSSGLLVLLTVGMEELAAFLIFECPCNTGNMDNFVYGMSYLLGPAIILFLIGLAYQVKILSSGFRGQGKRPRGPGDERTWSF